MEKYLLRNNNHSYFVINKKDRYPYTYRQSNIYVPKNRVISQPVYYYVKNSHNPTLSNKIIIKQTPFHERHILKQRYLITKLSFCYIKAPVLFVVYFTKVFLNTSHEFARENARIILEKAKQQTPLAKRLLLCSIEFIARILLLLVLIMILALPLSIARSYFNTPAMHKKLNNINFTIKANFKHFVCIPTIKHVTFK